MVSLPPDLNEFVRLEIESGRFGSEQDVVTEGIRLLKARQRKREQLQNDIAAAVKQIENGEYVEYDDDSLRDFFEELKQDARNACVEAESRNST